MKEISSEFLESVMLRMLREVGQEVLSVNEMAKQTAMRLLIDAYVVQKGSTTQNNILKSTLLHLEKLHLQQRKKDINVVHHETEDTNAKAFTRPNAIKMH